MLYLNFAPSNQGKNRIAVQAIDKTTIATVTRTARGSYTIHNERDLTKAELEGIVAFMRN